MDGFYLAFGEGLSEEANRMAQALAGLLLKAPPEGLWEAVPAYGTLYLEYDARRLSRKRLLGLVSRLATTLAETGEESRLVEIPVRYDGEDLLEVAGRTGLPLEEVKRLHQAPLYRVYALGFTPGFPFVVPKAERPFPTGNQVMYDTTLGWRLINPKMQALYGTESMGETAENLAEMYQIPREEQDRFALLSHQKAIRAWDEGRFAKEVVPVPVKRGKEEVRVEVDEGPRRDTSLEKLAQLRPVFREGGTVTAGNSSPLNDGAAAVLLVSDAIRAW